MVFTFFITHRSSRNRGFICHFSTVTFDEFVKRKIFFTKSARNFRKKFAHLSPGIDDHVASRFNWVIEIFRSMVHFVRKFPCCSSYLENNNDSLKRTFAHSTVVFRMSKWDYICQLALVSFSEETASFVSKFIYLFLLMVDVARRIILVKY